MSQTLTDQITPINPYEDLTGVSSETYAKEIHEQIAEDLKEFGEVIDTSGTIAHTRRHGIIFHDVSVTLRHAWLRMPMKLSVERDSETKTLSYRNEQGRVIPLRPKSFDPRLELHPEERRALKDVAARVRGHKVWSPIKSQRSLKRVDRDSILYGGVASTAPILVDVLASDPPHFGATLSAAAVAFLGGCIGSDRMMTRSIRREVKEVNEAVDAWNKDPQATMNSFFASSSEQAVFIDALMSLCDAHGIKYMGGLQVCVAHTRTVWQKWDYDIPLDSSDVEKIQSGSINWVPVVHGMIQFQGSREGWKNSGPFMFDGHHFYSYYTEPHRMLCPVG